MANRRAFAILLIGMVLMQALSGCLGKDEEPEIEAEESPFGFENPIPSNVWYHYAGGINALDGEAVAAANLTVNLTGNSAAASAMIGEKGAMTYTIEVENIIEEPFDSTKFIITTNTDSQ